MKKSFILGCILLSFFTVIAVSCDENVEEDTVAISPSTPPTANTPPPSTDGDPEPNTPDTPDTNNTPNTPDEPATPIEPQPKVISFSKEVQPIFNLRCVGCHGGNRFPDVRTHASIAGNAAIIKSVIVSRRMPQGGSLPNDQIELIRDWIDAGALNN